MSKKNIRELHISLDLETFSELELRKECLSMSFDKLMRRIVNDYLDRYPREDFDFPQGY